MNLGAIKENFFWVGTGIVLALLLGVGGWEIWSSLSEASDHADRFDATNGRIKARSGAPIPSDREIQYWKDLQADYEKDFQAVQARLAREEEEYEDVYFQNALTADYRAKGAVLPKGLEIDVARATEHWAIRNRQHKIPKGAFEESGFRAAYATARKILEKKARMPADALKLPAVEGPDVSASILEAQKAYWAAYRFVALVETVDPAARVQIESIDFTLREAPRGGGASGKGPTDGVRETPFYRTLPFKAELSVDFSGVPGLLETVLNPEKGKSVGAFRFRDRLRVEYSARGAVGTFEADPLGGGGGGGGGKKPNVPAKSAAGGHGTRVRVTMDLELWDWEIAPLAEYRPGGPNG